MLLFLCNSTLLLDAILWSSTLELAQDNRTKILDLVFTFDNSFINWSSAILSNFSDAQREVIGLFLQM